MRPLEDVPNNLPLPLTSFVGRRAEAAEVAELVAAYRLVTLTGAGGAGKTRLSLEVAARVGAAFADGVWWVDLARLSNDALLANAVAAPLAIKEVPGQPLLETVAYGLRNKHALLVLDNCEHVVDACAAIVHHLLQACRSLSILTTSREPLGVEGEASWRVPSLRLQDEAVELFVDRATSVKPAFRLTEENAATVAEIVRRLDGIPLAIELGAARVRMMTPEQILAGLEDRFRLLVGSSRTSVPRHRTLRASVDWSYDLLTDEERVALRRLAVFAGGFSLDAAENVCSGEGIVRDDVLDIVAGLIDRSLLQVGEEAPVARYRLLETIRQYASERLAESGEDDAVRARHLGYFVSLAERADAEISGDGLLKWLPILDVEHDNLRAAFDWSVRSRASEECLRLSSALWQFWMARGHLTEGRSRLAAALGATEAAPRMRAKALVGTAQLMLFYGDFAEAGEVAEEALKIARGIADGGLQGRALDTFAWSVTFLDPPSAPKLFDEAATLLQEADDGLFLADTFNGLGIARYFAGDYVRAREALQEGVAHSRRIGNPQMLTIGLGVLGYTLGLQGRLARARTCLRESLAVSRRLRDRVFTAQSLYSLGFIDAHGGDHAKAQAALDESVEIVREVSPGILAFALLTDGFARYIRADLDGAVDRLNETLEISRDIPVPWLRAWALALLGNIARLRGDLGGARARVDEARAAARAGGMRVAVPIDADARLARAAGEPDTAESLHHEALAASVDAESVLLVPAQLEALAGLAATFESFPEAARLFGAAEAARDAHGLVRYEIDRDEYESDVEHVRDALSDAEFGAAWEQGREMSLDDAIAYASRGRGERKRPSSGWASLTPTEVAVVRHVAEGLKNAQIAERLFVSPSTIKVHLSHIFAKLGLTTRAELAAQATRRTL